jgi:hypothetical protein
MKKLILLLLLLAPLCVSAQTVTDLTDPGSNGVVKRTSLGITGVATSTDLIALWTGTCDATHALFGDGTCQAISSGFAALTSGTNTTAAMHVGTGASLDPTGSGTITATALTAAKTQGTDTKYATDDGTGVGGQTICRDANAGISTTGCSNPFVSGLVTSGLLAEYRFNEGTGTTLTDYSGNGNNGTFCASAPSWIAGNPTQDGLRFNGTSNCINLPSALNSARTIIIVGSFIPGNNRTIVSPVCGTTTIHNLGILGRGFNVSPIDNSGVNPIATSNGGEYFTTALVNGSYAVNTIQSASGTQIIAAEFGSSGDGTHDAIFVNDNIAPYGPVQPNLFANNGFGSTGQSAGSQTSGNFVLGGSASGSCMSAVSTWWNGGMYYALFYSTYLTPAQLGQDFNVIQQAMAQRGIYLGYWNAGPALGTTQQNLNNQYVAVGDSITYGTGVATTFTQYMTFPSTFNTWNWVNLGLPSIQALQYAAEGLAQTPQSWIYPNAASNAMSLWLGTNDCSPNTAVGGQGAYGNLVMMARQMRLHGTTAQNQRLLAASMISRTGSDTCKNGFNAPFRQQWSSWADAFIDVAADPNLGADGANANTTYFQGDAVHPTTYAQANDIAPIFQRGLRRAFGNRDWSTATTYTTTAPAAVATTAGSESGNTVTLTFATAPCVQGNQVTVAGVTPAGYNGTFNVLSRTATQITYYDVSGLGAVTVQGTASCPMQQDEDVYTILGGSATTPNFTLETCVGYTGQNLYIKNSNTTSPWTVTPFGSETIDGAASLTMPTATSGNNPVVILQSTLVSAAAGGCNWKRVQ